MCSKHSCTAANKIAHHFICLFWWIFLKWNVKKARTPKEIGKWASTTLELLTAQLICALRSGSSWHNVNGKKSNWQCAMPIRFKSIWFYFNHFFFQFAIVCDSITDSPEKAAFVCKSWAVMLFILELFPQRCGNENVNKFYVFHVKRKSNRMRKYQIKCDEI